MSGYVPHAPSSALPLCYSFHTRATAQFTCFYLAVIAPWIAIGSGSGSASCRVPVIIVFLYIFFLRLIIFFSLRPFTPFAYLSHLFVVSPLFVLGLRSLHTINRSIDIFQLNSVIANRRFYTRLIGHVSHSELLVIDRNWLECCARRNVYNLRLHGC